MPNNLKTVKKLYDACMNKDFDTVKSLLHPKYSLKDPMMELSSAQEFIDMMEACPGGRLENVNFIAEGNKVVGTFDMVPSEPGSPRIRMCSIITMEDGKVRSEEMYYDTAQIPKDLKDQMKKSMPDKKRAA